MTVSELFTLMSNGTTNQKNFIESLTFNEFERIIEFLEDEYYTTEFISEIRGWINGGVMRIVDAPNDWTVLEISDGKFLEIQ